MFSKELSLGTEGASMFGRQGAEVKQSKMMVVVNRVKPEALCKFVWAPGCTLREVEGVQC